MFEKTEKQTEEKKESKRIALKDFRCFHKGKVYEIKKGEAVEVPLDLLKNLKTEKVIGS